MNPKLFFAIVLAALVAGIFAYTTIRWRRAPAAFRAMNYVALLSLVVGITIGAVAMRVLTRPESPERAHGGGESGDGAAGPSVKREPTTGIPVKDVVNALGDESIKHLKDAKWQPWYSVAQDCRLGLADPHSLRCEAAFIDNDPDGYKGEWKEHSDLIPYDVVIQFCDAGWADKDSKVCVAAYRFGSKSR
jgi:hypothetical protein